MRNSAAGILIVFLTAAAMAAEKTVITGDQMEIIKNGEKVVFSGNPKVTRGKSVLRAKRIIQDKKRDKVEAAGAITFSTVTEENEPMQGRAEKAYYDMVTGDGELFGGRPSITYQVKDTTGPVYLNADRIVMSQERQEMQAEGNVEIITSSATALAPRAVFLQSEKKAVLSGAPVQPEIRYHDAEQKGNYFADLITVFVNSRHVIMEGNVKGKVYFVSKSSAAAVTQ